MITSRIILVANFRNSRKTNVMRIVFIETLRTKTLTAGVKQIHRWTERKISQQLAKEPLRVGALPVARSPVEGESATVHFLCASPLQLDQAGAYWHF